jgi:hypothetical protein
MYVFIISKVQESFTTFKWCVIHMTYKTKVIIYMIKKINTQRLYHILERIDIMIIFQNKMQNLTKVLHLKKIIVI